MYGLAAHIAWVLLSAVVSEVRSAWAGPRMSGVVSFDTAGVQLEALAIGAGQVAARHLSGCHLAVSTSQDSLLLAPLLR